MGTGKSNRCDRWVPGDGAGGAGGLSPIPMSGHDRTGVHISALGNPRAKLGTDNAEDASTR